MKALLTVCAMAVSAGLGTWVYKDSARRMAVTTPPPAERMVAVEVTHLANSSIEDGVELVGGLEARSDVELRTTISAYIVRLLADSGDFVQQGQVVAELEDAKLQEAVTYAQAALHLAQAQLQAQQTRLSQSQKHFRRQAELAQSGVSTPQQREDAETLVSVGKAEVDLEQARVDQAQADLLHAKLALNDARIVAPMSGFVAERHADVGELSKPDVVLMRIVDISTVRTVIHIGEGDYPKVATGQQAHMTVDSFPGRQFEGKVIHKAPVLDPLTRTADVFIEIVNREKLLKPGMHSRVRLVFDRHREAKVLPMAALLDDGQKRAVFVLSGNPSRAKLTRVRTGYADGDVIEILSGLSPRDRVVVSGAELLKEGETVAGVERSTAALASSETVAAKPGSWKHGN
jgi:membrane fusion protein, multidrug efflux system